VDHALEFLIISAKLSWINEELYIKVENLAKSNKYINSHRLINVNVAQAMRLSIFIFFNIFV